MPRPPSHTRSSPPLVRQLVVAGDDVLEPRADDAGRTAPDRRAKDEIPSPPRRVQRQP